MREIVSNKKVIHYHNFLYGYIFHHFIKIQIVPVELLTENRYYCIIIVSVSITK